MERHSNHREGVSWMKIAKTDQGVPLILVQKPA
jgi:hypothetical protein